MQVQQNFSLKDYNTFGIEASARYFASFSSIESLEKILERRDNSLPLMVLGSGSNILFTKPFSGWVLKNDLSCISQEREEYGKVYLKAGGGLLWHSFVMNCVNQNLGGVENLSLIPGSVGASPIQNIGAYGVEIKDVFYELEAYDLQENKVKVFSLEECRFGYRDSIFKSVYKNRFIILNVTFALQRNPVLNTSYGAIQAELERMGVTPSVQSVSEAVISIRQSKLPDPSKIGNAGSFFKNPMVSKELFSELKMEWPLIPSFETDTGAVKLPAAWLIEQCGWKGYRSGDAGCYPLQPLVLVNYGSATGIEIMNLSKQIIQSVSDRFGIVLDREVNVF